MADGVTDDDIKELFESVGPVKFAAIEWDRRWDPPQILYHRSLWHHAYDLYVFCCAGQMQHKPFS